MSKLKLTALSFLHRAGLFALARGLTQHRARIIVYHRFTATNTDNLGACTVDQFRAHLEIIRASYHPLSLRELGVALAKRRSLPPRSVIITVDDGYRDFYDYAFPLIQEYEIPTTIFVVTGFVDGRCWIWTDKIHYLRELGANFGALGKQNYREEVDTLYRIDPVSRDQRLHDLAEASEISLPTSPPSIYEPLNWTQLKKMQESNFVDVGSHTVTHPNMSTLNEKNSRLELLVSREEIESHLGVLPETFCYPFGMQQHYRAEHTRMVRESGYLCAVASHFGLVGSDTDPWALPRFGGDEASILRFRKKLDGFEYLQQRAKREIRQYKRMTGSI